MAATPAAAPPAAPPAAPVVAPAAPPLGVDECLRNALATALRRMCPGAPPGGGGGGGGGGSRGGGGGGGSGGVQLAPIPPQQLVPVPLAANIRNMGTLPWIFEGERDKADAFINELLGYLLLNANVPGFTSLIHQVALALTLIKGS
jgi:hypothetical protein